MAWIAIDKDGTEKMFQSVPDRNTDYWFIDRNSIFNYNVCICLPKGFIKKYIGITLTWEDGPVEIV